MAIQPSHLGTELGACEEQTEAYMQYEEGAPEPATTFGAKSNGEVSGSSRKQAIVMRRLYAI